jgi:hypothetical protein
MTNKKYETIKEMLESGDQETVTLGINILGAAMSNSDFNLLMLVNTWCDSRIDIGKTIINLFPDDSEECNLDSVAAALKLYCIFKDKIFDRDILTIKHKIDQINESDYKKIKKTYSKSSY